MCDLAFAHLGRLILVVSRGAVFGCVQIAVFFVIADAAAGFVPHSVLACAPALRMQMTCDIDGAAISRRALLRSATASLVLGEGVLLFYFFQLELGPALGAARVR